jgi:hypothetical protein
LPVFVPNNIGSGKFVPTSFKETLDLMKSAAEQITGLCPSSSFGVQHGYGKAQIRQKISGKSETNWQLKTLSALMSIELCFHGHRISTSLSPWRGKAWLFQIVSVPYILKPLF